MQHLPRRTHPTARLAVLLPLLALLAASPCPPCRAAGLIVIHDPPARSVPGHFAFAPLEVTYHRVTVDIADPAATTTVEQEFYNPNGQRLEGTYLFPLPAGAHVDKFQMDIDGRMQQAELLDADKARALYEDVVRRNRDPALLEYAGRDAFKVRIFPIEPRSRKLVKITYTQLLKSDGGLTEYSYPLNTEKFSARPLRDVSVRVNLSCKDSLKGVYSPSHPVDVRRDGDRRASIGWEAHGVRPDTDFKILFSRTDKPLGVDLLTYRTGGEDGYFLLMASPGMTAPRGGVQKKDICFVIDTSGSMAENDGKKMAQAKKALSFCLQNLNDGDRFGVVRFSTEAESLFDGLVEADREHLSRAQEFVAGLKPIGGTAISAALTRALLMQPPRPAGGSRDGRSDRPFLVIFLTDGQPTVGERDPDRILADVRNAGGGAVRVFSFGVGTDVNTHLLDRLADDTQAFSQYVLPDEDLEVKLGTFFTRIREPVLTNVRVAFDGGNVRDSQLYPTRTPDLFKGDQLVLFGRYTGSGPAAVRISGTLNGERHEFTTDVRFADSDRTNSFIPRLWATRRVGYLLDEIRLHGESRELKEEVIRLAREHGIVTPYTAYLILEDERRRNVPPGMQTFRELDADRGAKEATSGKYNSARSEARDLSSQSGNSAVANAQDVARLKAGQNLQDSQFGDELAKAPAAGAGAAAGRGRGGRGGGAGSSPAGAAAAPPAAPADFGYRKAQNYAQQARVVGGRTFYQNGNTWTDAAAQDVLAKNKDKQRTVKFNSDDYFALLKRHPEAAAWLSLGEEVDVVLGDEVVMVR